MPLPASFNVTSAGSIKPTRKEVYRIVREIFSWGSELPRNRVIEGLVSELEPQKPYITVTYSSANNPSHSYLGEEKDVDSTNKVINGRIIKNCKDFVSLHCYAESYLEAVDILERSKILIKSDLGILALEKNGFIFTRFSPTRNTTMLEFDEKGTFCAQFDFILYFDQEIQISYPFVEAVELNNSIEIGLEGDSFIVNIPDR